MNTLGLKILANTRFKTLFCQILQPSSLDFRLLLIVIHPEINQNTALVNWKDGDWTKNEKGVDFHWLVAVGGNYSQNEL